MTTHEELCRALTAERFGQPTPRPAPLPHIPPDALRELLEELGGEGVEVVAA